MVSLIIAIVSIVVSAALNFALAPHNTAQNASAATLNDLQIPQTDEGTAQNVLFGDRWTASWFVMWYGNFNTESVWSKSDSKK